MFNPRGSIIKSARLRKEDDGAVLTLSAPAILVTVFSSSEARRMLRRAAAAAGCILEAVEDSYCERDGTFNRRTGARQRDEDVHPCTFRVIGPPEGLERVCSAACVKAWFFGVSIRIPVGAAGAGEVTPSAGKRIREAKRETGERAAERDRAERRPFNPPDPQAETVRRLAPGADAETTVLVAELVRYAARASTLSDSEKARVAVLRRVLGA